MEYGEKQNIVLVLLSIRQHSTSVDGQNSELRKISHGDDVPQGSVLGPELIIIFINNISLCCHR